MIKIQNLIKRFYGEEVLNIPSWELKKGEIVGLAGNNGAGKTTLIKLILDLLRADQGQIELQGINVASNEEWKSFTSAFLDESFTIGYLTPEEFWQFSASLRNLEQEDIQEQLKEYSSFSESLVSKNTKLIRDLSKGNQKKAGIIASLLGHQKLCLLDEPFANLDPSSQIDLREMISKENQLYGTTFLISDHNLENITRISNRIVIIDKGKFIKDHTTTEDSLKELERFFARKKEPEDFM